MKKTSYFQNTTNIKFDCFIISFDHFLQPKDNNTQHKSKISHVIFIHHHELSPTLVPRGHGTAVQFSMSDSMGSSSPPAQVQMCWIASVKYLRRGHMYRYTQKTTDTFTDYKRDSDGEGNLPSMWYKVHLVKQLHPVPLTDRKKICFLMKINWRINCIFPNVQRSVHVSQDIVNSGDLRNLT